MSASFSAPYSVAEMAILTLEAEPGDFLARLAERLDPAGAEASAQVRDRLRLWQGDPDLAGVRAKDALAGLPDEERQRWERLWSDVDALLRRVSAPE